MAHALNRRVASCSESTGVQEWHVYRVRSAFGLGMYSCQDHKRQSTVIHNKLQAQARAVRDIFLL